MTQQTAVEYLIEKLYTEYRFSFSGTIVDEAKAMEKEQIMMAFNDGKVNLVLNKRNSEQYYNETYESK
jgi:hypothetical protein